MRLVSGVIVTIDSLGSGASSPRYGPSSAVVLLDGDRVFSVVRGHDYVG